MPHYKYLIIGGGMTGDAALHGIREVDRDGSIGLIGSEAHPPYNRPPLSKALWKGKPLESIWRKDDEQNVTFHFGRTARKLDAQTKRVTDNKGTVYTFDKLLLATGSTPRRLPFGGEKSFTSARWTITSGCIGSPSRAGGSRSSVGVLSDRRSPQLWR